MNSPRIFMSPIPFIPALSSAKGGGQLASRLILFCLGCLALATGGRATTVRSPEFADLVNQSDFIVRAVVKSVTAEYAQPGSRKIVTKVALEVKEVIAGTPPQPLVLRVMGGKIGDEEMILEGAPQFKVGDEDILFVQGNGKQIYPLVAMMHGRYPIEREAGTGREFMTRSNKVPLQDTSEVAQPMTDGSAAQLQLRMKSSGEALTPAEFVQQIKAAVKSPNLQHRE